MTKIRNIMQSVQEREVIKTSPDMIVYIEGLPFLVNRYIKKDSDNKNPTVVNFNDFVTAVQTSYSIDSLIPTGSISLSIPNGMKYLFMAPGGNTVFDVMSSIRVYSKGYFYSQRTNNTVYRRVFNGLIQSISFNETPTSLEVQLHIVGILRLLEIAQIEMAPSLMSESSVQVTPYKSDQGPMSVYEALYDVFDRALDFSEFVKHALGQTTIGGTKSVKSTEKDVAQVLIRQWMAKWTLRLTDLRRDVRLFAPGVNKTKALVGHKYNINADNAKNKIEDAQLKGQTKTTTNDIASWENADYVQKLREYHFDMAISPIQLSGANLTPRVERIRHLIEIAGYEGYQDLDGLIMIKPPLYNLDCTVLGSAHHTEANLSATGIAEINKSLNDENIFTDMANPYIIHLSEILSESYTEDEQGIRRTAMTLTSNFGNPGGLQLNEGTTLISSVVRHVDINLIKKFGVRDESAKYCGFLHRDAISNYGFAVCELNKANRNYRTYNVTIPLRPEIRLGFPVYIPHKDMYGYVVAASISYTVAGQATMSLTCNYIRKRPLFKQIQTTNVDGKTQNIQVFVSQPNMVHLWTKKGSENGEVVVNATGKDLVQDDLDLLGVPGTLSNLESRKLSDQQKAVLDYRRKKLGDLFETWSDGYDGSMWRIQRDKDAKLVTVDGKKVQDVSKSTGKTAGPPWYDGDLNKDTGLKSSKIVADNGYMRRLAVVQPYTDEKGYEVIPGLPWGRYTTLKQALVDFTRNYWFTSTVTDKEEAVTAVRTASSFVTGGLAVPTGGAASELQSKLAGIPSQISDATINDWLDTFELFDKGNLVSFELQYKDGNPTPTEPGQDAPDTQDTQDAAPATEDNASAVAAEQESGSLLDKVRAFLQAGNAFGATEQTGPLAVSLLPQNTDIGGYIPPSGVFSGTWMNISSGFTSSAYGDIFGLRPTTLGPKLIGDTPLMNPARYTPSAYNSGNEAAGNIG